MGDARVAAVAVRQQVVMERGFIAAPQAGVAVLAFFVTRILERFVRQAMIRSRPWPSMQSGWGSLSLPVSTPIPGRKRMKRMITLSALTCNV
jgi:hypothetical protein